MREHLCVNDTVSTEPTWWEYDAQGIELCRVCEKCREEKLSRYRPEILTGYDQSDVDEPIEPEETYEDSLRQPEYDRYFGEA